MPDDIYVFRPLFRVEETLAAVRECLETGWTGLGFKTLEFERAWCEFTGLPHAHFVSSATAGLHLAVALLKARDGWSDGDEVISTPLTFVSTNHVLLYERLRPVFADIDEHLCLAPESILERITPRTRAVVFVGLGGNPGRLAEVARICRERGLRLILDAAHMSGTRVGGVHVGGEADVTVFSFHAVKNLPTADSGMICFTDNHLDREARKWSWMGIDKDTFSREHTGDPRRWFYDVEATGFKYHGNSVMAALGLVALRYLEQDNRYRRRLAARYEELLAGHPLVRTVPVPAGVEPSRHLFQVLVAARDEVVLALNRQRIYPGVHYRDNTEYPMYANQRGSCPRAAAASASVISMPMHIFLAITDVDRVCHALLETVESIPASGGGGNR
jgi:dTDP-4-amino-4,6-dideoxygalactose transaminase